MTATEVPCKKVAEVFNGAIDMRKKLPPGDFLASVSSVVSVVSRTTKLTTPTALTIGSGSVNTVSYVDGNTQRTVPALSAVLFSISGGDVDTLYKITVVATTTRGQTVEEDMYLKGIQ